MPLKLKFSVDRETYRSLQSKLKKIESMGVSMKSPLNRAGIEMMRRTDKRFVNQVSPDGEPWAPLSDITKTARRQGKKSKYGNKILRDTGTLFKSTTKKNAEGNEYNLSKTFVEFGTNVWYGEVHQFGMKVKPKTKKAFRFTVTKGKGKKKETTSFFRSSATIPARPFLGLNKSDQIKINMIFITWADQILR